VQQRGSFFLFPKLSAAFHHGQDSCVVGPSVAGLKHRYGAPAARRGHVGVGVMFPCCYPAAATSVPEASVLLPLPGARCPPRGAGLTSSAGVLHYLLVMKPIGYGQMARDRLDATFAALAHPTRRAILARLASGRASVTELAEPFAMSQPAISKHLKVLERAGLISRGRDAQRRPRRLEVKRLAEADKWLERYRRLWEGNCQRLDALLDELKTQERKPR